MTERPSSNLQDVLAGITCFAVVAASVQFTTATLTGSPSYRLWLHALCWMGIVPGGIGSALGCFVLGWRRAWRFGLLGVCMAAGFMALVALLVPIVDRARGG